MSREFRQIVMRANWISSEDKKELIQGDLETDRMFEEMKNEEVEKLKKPTLLDKIFGVFNGW